MRKDILKKLFLLLIPINTQVIVEVSQEDVIQDGIDDAINDALEDLPPGVVNNGVVITIVPTEV